MDFPRNAEQIPEYTEKGSDYSRPDSAQDLLFNAKYMHKEEGGTCAGCDKKQLVHRSDRPKDKPIIHYGNIASGSGVIRDALKRDQLGKDLGAVCFEMETAGLMDESQCLVIRGICDYSDSHKNKEWQRYAAAVAAAYAKELLGQVPRPNTEGISLYPDSIPVDTCCTLQEASIHKPDTPSHLSPRLVDQQFYASARLTLLIFGCSWSEFISIAPFAIEPGENHRAWLLGGL